MSSICNFYNDKTVFVTGCTGVLGTCLVEKILRSLQIRKLILMIRPKRGKSAEERIKEYTNNIVFSRIDKNAFNDKVTWVYGDLTSDNFGLSTDDLLMIKSSVNAILHLAATVRFDEPLATALKINFRSTKIILDIALECKQLQSFVYVSTAYSNFGKKLVEEKLYTQKFSPEFTLNMLKHLDDDTINKFGPIMMDPYPNTYTFSKGITELLVQQYAKKLPIGTFRPASIIASCHEPFPGWINKGTASNAIILEVACGRVRVLRVSKGDLNCAPVDMCANAMLAIGWDNFRNRFPQNKIYNFTSTNLKVPEYVKYSLSEIHDYPFNYTFYYPFLIMVQSALLYHILAFLLQTIPAILLEAPYMIIRRKFGMLALRRKTQAKIDLVASFMRRMDWTFDTNNTQDLWNSLSETDRKLFNFNLHDINWKEYLPQALCGLKKYFFKEKMDQQSINEAKNHYNRLRNIHMLIKYGLLALIVLTFASRM